MKMGGIAYLACALILLNVSCCTCVTTTWSTKCGSLSYDERQTVYNALLRFVNNQESKIQLDRAYHAGRIFSQYLNVNGKGVAIRLSHWSTKCSVSLLPRDTTRGSNLLKSLQWLLPKMKDYLINQGSDWAALSNGSNWMDYYVRESYAQLPQQPTDSPSYKTLHEKGTVPDCTIRHSMLLSHHIAQPFNRLSPGDTLLSPNGKIKLTIPGSDQTTTECVATLLDQNNDIVWQTTAANSQIACFLALRTDGALQLWNNNTAIWQSDSASSDITRCAGASSLAVENDKNIKLYSSAGNYLKAYWSAKESD